MKKKSFVILLATALVISGLSVIFWNSGSENQTLEDEERKEARISAEILKERGPRPETKRLRDGARQIETREDAFKEAENALKRVEAELASAAGPGSAERLSRKKKAIEDALERMKLR